jgi:hypothetical protein
MTEVVFVDPATLCLPPSREDGADPHKLARQIARFGPSVEGMPRPWVYRGSDNELMITNGVTRATRVAKLLPGKTIEVEVIGLLRSPVGHFIRVGNRIP